MYIIQPVVCRYYYNAFGMNAISLLVYTYMCNKKGFSFSREYDNCTKSLANAS